MTSLLAQLPALIGVIIGAVGSYTAVTLGDRSRFRREQSAQWRAQRLATYADYSRALKVTVSVTFRASAHLGNDPNPHPLTPDEAAERLRSAYDARDLGWEAMLLLGAPLVVEAARAWFHAASKMERFVQNQVRDPDAWRRLLEEQRATRAEFYSAARRDLALPPGDGGLHQLDMTHPDIRATGLTARLSSPIDE
ncbi:hypothetical protein [Dactylosporangium sp. NPDC051541]|uniref:hypothetical protein n=1 Tax=Dactylosporangium sp. NPDC051541 TaxID=3363977 RepID=UPI0037B695C8